MSEGKSNRESLDGNLRADSAAKVIASVIIAGIALMFGYGIISWMLFG
jgi:hypothetical protein